jgi:RHS repeat-associated protein
MDVRSPLPTPQRILRALLLVLLPACSPGGSGLSGGVLALTAEPGLPRYQRPAAIPVPGGIVNAAGGNLLVPRLDLSIDTRLGTRAVGAVYNSKTRDWLWSFDVRYDGSVFVDSTGARYDCTNVTDGDLIPGSVWIKLDAWRLRSVGGLVHEFDAYGRLAAIRWASAAHPRLEYDSEPIAGAPRTTEVRQCRAPGACATVYTVAYDAEGRVAEITDRAGRRAEYDYHADGQLSAARDAFDVARGLPGFRYEYQPGGRLTALTNSEGERVEFEIAWNARRVERVRQMGTPRAVHQFGYGQTRPASPRIAPDRWTRHTDPQGNATLYRFDYWRRLRKLRLPTGERTERGWSGYETSWVELPDGTVTWWEHVDDDEIIRHDPSGNSVHVNLRLRGGENRAQPFLRPIDRIEDDLGLVEARRYEAGRLVWVENGAGERTTFGYDAENMLASLTDAGGVALAFSDHGEHGHPQTLAFAGEVETRAYDAVGNLLSRSGFERYDLRPGGEVMRAYDEDRNVAELMLADAPLAEPPTDSSIAIEYRSDGRPLRIARPFGGDHEFVYDDRGALVLRRERVDGAWVTTGFEVDRLARITAVTLPNGMRRETEYDANGRVHARRTRRDGTLEAEAIFGWQEGRLVSVTDSSHAAPERYGYDAAGRIASTLFAEGETLEVDYDVRGRRTHETYRLPGASVLRELGFGYDLADRETLLSDGGASVLERSYAAGRLDEARYGNGLVRRFSYDPSSGLLAAATTEHPTQGLVEITSVDVALLGLPNAVSLSAETATTGPAAASTREEYLLGPADAASPEGQRLLAWSDGTDDWDLAYDALSNLSASEGGGLVHVYNAEHNRLLHIEDAASGAPVVAYAYDAAGYVTARDGVELAWTAQGRIAAIGEDAVFRWDAQGRPLRRSIHAEERLFRFGGRLEADAAGTPLRMDLDEVVLELRSGQRFYRHTDFRGNVKLVSDDAGGIVAHYAYAAYGIFELTGSSDDASSFARGRAVGDLVVLGARIHDPLAARFLAPDPVFQLVSQFTYTQGNPVWWWDAAGLEQTPSPALRSAAHRVENANELTLMGITLTVIGIGWGFPNVTLLGIGFTITGYFLLDQASFDLKLLQEQERQRRVGALKAPGRRRPRSARLATGFRACHPTPAWGALRAAWQASGDSLDSEASRLGVGRVPLESRRLLRRGGTKMDTVGLGLPGLGFALAGLLFLAGVERRVTRLDRAIEQLGADRPSERDAGKAHREAKALRAVLAVGFAYFVVTVAQVAYHYFEWRATL